MNFIVTFSYISDSVDHTHPFIHKEIERMTFGAVRVAGRKDGCPARVTEYIHPRELRRDMCARSSV